jgi:hypothetical protein
MSSAIVHSEKSQSRQPTRYRLILFSVLAGLICLARVGLTGAIPGLVAPWIQLPGNTLPEHTPSLHIWHGAEWGAFTVLLSCGCLVALLRKPTEKHLVFQFFVLVWFFLGIIGIIFSPAYTMSYVIIAILPSILVTLAYPGKRSLLKFSFQLSLKNKLMMFAVLSLLILLPTGIFSLLMQINGSPMDEHVIRIDWAKSFGINVSLIFAGFLTASRRPGWRTLGFLLAITYIYLGVASISAVNAPGSWGLIGGALSVIGGFILMILLRNQKVINTNVGM